MKNWSTDTSVFASAQKKRVWELVQGMNYGFEGETVSKTEIMTLWHKIMPHLVPQVRRLWELWLWDRTYSLPLTGSYWPKSAGIGI